MALKSARSFGTADYGVNWAISQLPRVQRKGRRIFAGAARPVELELSRFPNARGEDDYAVRFTGKFAQVLANSAVGTISGLLRVGELLRTGERRNITQHLKFRTRNYKHELNLGPFEHGRKHNILSYTDKTWEKLCQQIVSHQFNGLVLYPGYHPFEYILDYKGFPKAASQPAAHRTAVRKALNRGLNIAHRYGLKTFMQHYVNHFTQELADAYHIPTTGRLSAVEHPEVERYCRYCYREIFKQVPDLDGLYFNFESADSATEHILATAVRAGNAIKRKPIFVFRLWGYTDVNGMRRIMKAYKGRIILGHKIADTSDVYYLPVADSRVMEWKKQLGKKIEWMFLVGPCHNCGTNLCQQLWGDYNYVQTLLADARKKGADSFSFHTINDFFSPDLPGTAFSDEERALARFNLMHLQAVVDFVCGLRRSQKDRAAAMAVRAGVKPAAGPALLEAVEASSQLVLLIYQQFFNTSAYDGYINPGRYSQIQDPFYYFCASTLNDQHKAPMWRNYKCAWVPKTIPVTTTPKNEFQPIIDYVNPSKKKAARHPAKIAAQLGQNISAAQTAFKRFSKLAGKTAAAKLEPHLEANARLGEYVRREIRAAIQLYSIYFSQSKVEVLSALRKGLTELKPLANLVADPNHRSVKSMRRAMMDGMDPSTDIRLANEALSLISQVDETFPFKAFRTYLDSRRAYNEVRRVLRPIRRHDVDVIAYAAKQLNASILHARQALTQLEAPQHNEYSNRVACWLTFVENELARTTPPVAECPSQPNGAFLPLQHDDCFRIGENFLEDFCGFFKDCDFLRKADQSFQVWHTDQELCVTFRERGIDSAQRMAQWEQYKNSGSDCFVTRVMIDVENKGHKGRTYIVWPKGASVSRDRQPDVKAATEFSTDASSWQVTVRLPFAELGRRPRNGDIWGLNVSANPAIARNCSYTWSVQYDCFNPRLFGKLQFT
jgi:hypothetical protein